MKIAIDAGALCGPRLGNYIFTENLINGLLKHDKKNKYCLYSFCNKPKNIKLLKNYKYEVLLPKFNWMKFRISIQEKLKPSDVFLSLNQSIPQTNAKIISFSHGLSFIKLKNLYSKDYSRLKNQLDNMIKKSKYIVVSSEKVRKEIINYGASENQVKTFNFGTPYDFLDTKKRALKKYFLYVGSTQSIKNIKFIIKSFEKFLHFKKEYKLILVLDSFIKSNNNNIKIKANITRKSLKELYVNASAYLSASYYESFNFPVLEALSQKCPVIALKSSVIPEMQKYVNIANNSKEFIKLMEDFSNNPISKIDLHDLKKEFSWKNYVRELCNLYNR